MVEKAKEMQAKYPKLKECAALVKLGLTAADTVSVCYIPFVKIAWSCVVLIGMCSLKFTASSTHYGVCSCMIKTGTVYGRIY